MKKPFFNLGDLLASKDLRYMGMVKEISITLTTSRDGSPSEKTTYVIEANGKRVFLDETNIRKLDEVCPF